MRNINFESCTKKGRVTVLLREKKNTIKSGSVFLKVNEINWMIKSNRQSLYLSIHWKYDCF
jgi:hypothetical protein